jgi:hypothetical protein
VTEDLARVQNFGTLRLKNEINLVSNQYKML